MPQRPRVRTIRASPVAARLRFAYVLNPAAKNGQAGRRWPDLAARLHAVGLGGPAYTTVGAGDAERLAREAAEHADVVVVAGGDGTIHEAVNGLAGTGAVLGVLPFGTGNDFAHALGMPAGVPEAVAALAAARPRPTDLGRVRWEVPTPDGGSAWHERRFANCLGVGFDALAALGAARTKWLGGNAAYVAAVLQALWELRGAKMRARVTVGDGDAPDVTVLDGPLFLAEVGNEHSIGGGFLMTPDATPHDGRLDVCVVRHLPTRRALRLLPSAIRGAHVGRPEVTMTGGTRVRLTANTFSLPVQADGEGLTLTARAVEVEIEAGAVQALAVERDGVNVA